VSRRTEKQRTTVDLKRPAGDPLDRVKRKLTQLEHLVAELKAADSLEAQLSLWSEVADLAAEAKETIGFARLMPKR
jgi:hypothetical protein